MSTELLQLKHISKVYNLGDQTLYALNDLSVDIHQGEFVAVVGPSGCGKSTFLHVASLLDKPSLGQVLIKGRNVTDYTEEESAALRNKEIGFIFQQFNLLTKTSALDNVSLPLIYAGIPEKTRISRSREILTEVGLQDRLKNTPAQLSGGQQQRVAIARALVTNPSIIFADEPTGNLDSKSGAEIKKMIIKLNNEAKTVVLVTHDSELAQIAKRVINLADGKVVSDKLTKWGKEDKKTYSNFEKWQTLRPSPGQANNDEQKGK